MFSDSFYQQFNLYLFISASIILIWLPIDKHILLEVRIIYTISKRLISPVEFKRQAVAWHWLIFYYQNSIFTGHVS